MTADAPGPVAGCSRLYTLVAFHAHPDDEAILTGGTLAKAATDGHRVVIVVATLGEAGLTGDALPDADSLAARRLDELRRSAAALGCVHVEWLGFADSGLGRDTLSEPAFAAAPTEAAAEALADVLRRERADALTIYDPAGGYGHPDHVQVHHVGRRAAALAGTPVVLEATVDRQALLRLTRTLSMIPGLPPGFRTRRLRGSFSAHSRITHRVDVRDHLIAKRAAVAAHGSQHTGGPTARSLSVFLGLPKPVFRWLFGYEWYVEHGRDPERARLDDVFATLRADSP